MQAVIKCKCQNLALGLAMKDWRTVYQLSPTPHLLQLEVHKGRLCYRQKGTSKRISYDRIKAGLIKKHLAVTLEIPFCPF
jgi:hypothetical protein